MARQCKHPIAMRLGQKEYVQYQEGRMRDRGLDVGFCGHLTRHPSGYCRAHRPENWAPVYEKLPHWTNGRRTFCCIDCGCAPDAPQLKDGVWLTIAKKEDLLCCGCTEARLGREISHEDLRKCPMNGALLFFMAKKYP